MGIISWSLMALQDLREATDSPAVLQRLLSLAETELRYPPIGTADEGYLREYNRGFAYRRALPRSAPTRNTDLRADPNEVDLEAVSSVFGDSLEDFEFEDYYYVYRQTQQDEARELGNRGQVARLTIARLLPVSRIIAELKD